MSIRTLFLYLIGNRQAILQIANCPKAFVVGFLFVLSAGLAREYDGEDLLNEPWYAFIPVGASIGSSMILFLVTYGIAEKTNKTPVPYLFSAYLSFLSLYWMTAPLAWLYAVPYERFLTPADAVRANLLTLGIVAAWRVALIVRVISVWMGFRVLEAFFLVMVFADALVLITQTFVSSRLLGVMGGMPLSETEMMIEKTSDSLAMWGCCSLLIWFSGAVVYINSNRPGWYFSEASPKPVSRLLWALAAVSVAVWAFILPITQPEQILRRQVERALIRGRIAEALAEMSARGRSDFPPHWSPPPHSSNTPPGLMLVLEAMVDSPPAPWVREIYFEKIPNYLKSNRQDRDLIRLVRVLEQLPAGKELIEQSPTLKLMLEKQGTPSVPDRE